MAMKRLLILATLSTLAIGCGSSAMVPRVTTAKADITEAPIEKQLPSEPDVAPLTKARQIGDFIVYRFSGSFRDAPVEVTHEVVGRKGDALLIDVTVEDRGMRQRLRMRVSNDGQLLSVARWDGGVLRPFGVAAFETMMSELTLAADENLGLIEERASELEVAGAKVDATVSRYRVRVGAHDAIMVTKSAPSFAWGDVGGEIRTNGGKVLYRAEIVDSGHADRHGIAAQEEGDVYEGYDFLDSI